MLVSMERRKVSWKVSWKASWKASWKMALPVSLDFDNPFDKVDYEELLSSRARSSPDFNDMYTFAEDDPYHNNDGTFNFANFMKSIESLSYSAMFTHGNSKKFTFKPLTQQIEENNNPGKEAPHTHSLYKEAPHTPSLDQEAPNTPSIYIEASHTSSLYN